MLTGFHGIHVLMVLYLFCSIYTINKDHLLPQVIWALKLGLVLAFCGCVWLLLFVMFTPMAAMLFKLLIILINKFF